MIEIYTSIPVIMRLPNRVNITVKDELSDTFICISAENGGSPPTQNGDIRSLFWLFSLMALQN